MNSISSLNEVNAESSVENIVEGDDCTIYELAREDQILSQNEVAKFKIATELRRQGISIKAISRLLSIAEEELYREFERNRELK